MIDELVLEQLLGELAEEIEVPADGADRVVHELNASARPARVSAPRRARIALVAAGVIVVVGVGVSMLSATKSSTTKAAGAPTASSESPAQARARAAAPNASSLYGNTGLKAIQGTNGPRGLVGQDGGQGGVGLPGGQGVQGGIGPQGPSGAQGVSPQGGASSTVAQPPSSGPVDGAKIVKTGSLELQVPKGALTTAALRVTNVAAGVGGYVSRSQTDNSGSSATASITIRVPVNAFDSAVKQLKTGTGVKVLGDSESGVDVTAQYANLQAKMTADIAERDSFITLLAQANNIGDILTVRDRITAVQSEIDQYQGQINVLSDQSTYSSIAVLLSEKPPKPPKPAVVHHVSPPTGLEKSWSDARSGFANSVEWFIARSGGALIVFLAALLLLFALRYLYPVVRRALL